MQSIPIITLHDGYIRVILEHKVIVIETETEEVQEFVRKSRVINDELKREHHR